MSTRKQRAASRANAQKSTGPRTEAGKAASRFNALKHGIDAKQQVTATESAEDLSIFSSKDEPERGGGGDWELSLLSNDFLMPDADQREAHPGHDPRWIFYS
jgi:hypothetical protein